MGGSPGSRELCLSGGAVVWGPSLKTGTVVGGKGEQKERGRRGGKAGWGRGREESGRRRKEGRRETDKGERRQDGEIKGGREGSWLGDG